MRFLVACLLVANLGLFAWTYTQPAPPTPTYRAAPMPSGVAPLVLFSEKLDSSPVAIAIEKQPEPKPTKAPVIEVVEALPAVRICQAIGPIVKSRDADQITQRLEAQDYEVRRRSGRVRQPSGYKVYLPARPAAEARQIVNALDKNGMKDHFIGKKNYISLGIFRSRDQAQIRFEQVTALGYEPILGRHYRSRTVHWLDVDETGQPLLTAPVWQQIQAQYPDIQMQHASCE